MSAIQTLMKLKRLHTKHLEALRQEYNTMAKANALIAEYRATTGNESCSLQDALYWRATNLAVTELNSEGQ
uniref:Uncharacterized protein n=1 Tax=viral metagenome TaxID=1070528 RepID=A0A6H1ZXE8_9ZZZZ